MVIAHHKATSQISGEAQFNLVYAARLLTDRKRGCGAGKVAAPLA
jgi:hypothetical protein